LVEYQGTNQNIYIIVHKKDSKSFTQCYDACSFIDQLVYD